MPVVNSGDGLRHCAVSAASRVPLLGACSRSQLQLYPFLESSSSMRSWFAISSARLEATKAAAECCGSVLIMAEGENCGTPCVVDFAVCDLKIQKVSTLIFLSRSEACNMV